MKRAALLFLLFVLPLCAFAQPSEDPAPEATGPSAPEEQAPAAPEPPTVDELVQRWQRAWLDRPALVAAAVDDESVPDAIDRSEHVRWNLTQLNRKSLSNRAWKGFWRAQRDTAQALADAVAAQGGDDPQLLPLRDWVKLAEDKMANQDVLLDALQARRSSLEEQFELPPMAAPEPPPPLGEDATPYERRSYRIAELKRSLATQQRKQSEQRDLLEYLEAQEPSEVALIDALKTDEALARRELDIARAGSERRASGPLKPAWAAIAEEVAGKARRIAADLARNELDRRNRQLEVALLASEIELRTQRIAEVEASLAAEGSWLALARASQETAVRWLRIKAPSVVINLVLIGVFTLLALRFVTAVSTALISAAGNDSPDDMEAQQRTRTLVRVFASVVRLGIYATAALLALGAVGVDTGPILGSAAILGLAISFGSQNLVRDVVTGFFVLLENQFAVGDVVDIGGRVGKVERLTLRTTWVRNGLTGALHAIPNGEITSVANLTRDWSGVATELGVSYGTDLERLLVVVDEVAAQMAEDPAWKDKFVEVPKCQGLIRMGDSALVVRMLGKVLPGEQWAVDRELQLRMKLRFDEEGIEIPFPQRVVHHVGVPGPGTGGAD